MNNLYSIRMRASSQGKHISGGERLVGPDKIEATVSELVIRATSRSCTLDQITINIENLEDIRPLMLTALDLVTVSVSDPTTGRAAASRVLAIAGVSQTAIEAALNYLATGPAPSGSNMRGAMIMDAETGDRLEPDQERGVRASRFDWSEKAGRETEQMLKNAGLRHFRTREALALATKISNMPGVIAELCWSDDPDYTAGYVASRKTGYVRFPLLKEAGNKTGGRAIFVNRDGVEIDSMIEYLEKTVTVIDKVGVCRQVLDPEEYLTRIVYVQTRT